LTIYHDSTDNFFSNKEKWFSLCENIIEDFKKLAEVAIFFSEILLTNNGSVILVGGSPVLDSFRDKIHHKYNLPQHVRKNIIHITLGRLLQETSSDNMQSVFNYLHHRGKVSLPELIVNTPKFIISRDVLGHKIDNALTDEFNKI
jgi:hypothetical protein